MKNKNPKKTEEQYPNEYRTIFKAISGQENNFAESEEINEIRKATEDLNHPQYTFSSSTSGSVSTFRVIS